MTDDAATSRPAEPPTPRGDRRARKYKVRRRLLALGVVLVVILAALGWYLAEAYPIGGSGRTVVFQVVQGETVAQVASTLASKGVISSSLAFRLDLMVTGDPDVQPGWYAEPASSSFSAVRAALARGPNAKGFVVTTAESDFEVAQGLFDQVSPAFAAQFTLVVHSGAVHSPFQVTPTTPLEGLLAPGVYVLTPGETARELVEQMTQRFVRRAAHQGLTPSSSVRGLDGYQVVIAASIVEKEGYYARNMPRTATVIYNRLERGMPLQMDSTVEYAINQDGGTVSAATERINSPYNTYLHTGLTPTPICIPSTEAIDAALHPPKGPWLYFVLVTKSGTMAFAATFAQQLANERLAEERGLP